MKVWAEQFRDQLVPDREGEEADGRHQPQLVDTGSQHGFSCASHLRRIHQGSITSVHNDIGPTSDFQPEGSEVVVVEDLQGLPHHGKDHEPQFTLVYCMVAYLIGNVDVHPLPSDPEPEPYKAGSSTFTRMQMQAPSNFLQPKGKVILMYMCTNTIMPKRRRGSKQSWQYASSIQRLSPSVLPNEIRH